MMTPLHTIFCTRVMRSSTVMMTPASSIAIECGVKHFWNFNVPTPQSARFLIITIDISRNSLEKKQICLCHRSSQFGERPPPCNCHCVSMKCVLHVSTNCRALSHT
jgi:hypothetical protein